MKITIEVPGEAQEDAARLVEWLHSDEHLISSMGTAVIVAHGVKLDDRATWKFAWRLLDAEVVAGEDNEAAAFCEDPAHRELAGPRELPTLEHATQADLRLAVAALGPLAIYGGFLRAVLAGMYAERERLSPGNLAVIAHDAYWRCKEVGDPPPFDSQPVKLQQCWLAAAEAVASQRRS